MNIGADGGNAKPPQLRHVPHLVNINAEYESQGELPFQTCSSRRREMPASEPAC